MRLKSTFALALIALVVGCGNRDAGLDVAPSIVDRARLGGELLFLDANHNELVTLDVGQTVPTPTVQRIRVRAKPKFIVERKGGARHTFATVAAGANSGAAMADPMQSAVADGSGSPPDKVLVLSDGNQDALGEYVDRPALAVIGKDHQVVNFELSAPFGQVVLSADGRHAILWGQPNDGQSDELLNNLNRVALVDLDAEPSDSNPYERTLKSTGGAISDVLITPPLTIAAEARPIALFSFGNGLGVWDIAHPTREDVTVEGMAVSGQFQLTRVVADPNAAKLYLAQQSLKDLRVLSFGALDDSTASNDFRLSLNSLSLGLNGASDMVLYDDGGISKVLVAVGSQLAIVDADQSRSSFVNLTAGGERLHDFTGRSPNDNDTKQRVLLWGPGRNTVSFVELTNLEQGGVKNIELLSLGYSLTDLIPLHGNLMLAVLGGGGIGTIDLDSRRFRPLAAAVTLGSPLIESDAKRVWVGGSNSDTRVGFFEPATLTTGSLRLDDVVQEMFLFEDGEQRRVVVTHDSPVGLVTIVDATKATRTSARSLAGFLVDGLVNR